MTLTERIQQNNAELADLHNKYCANCDTCWSVTNHRDCRCHRASVRIREIQREQHDLYAHQRQV